MQTPYFNSVKTLLQLVLIPLVMASCQKETPDHCARTMAGISGTYKPTGLTYKPGSTSPEQDYFAIKDACEKDDLVDLNLNGTYNYRDIGLVCSPEGSNSGTWSVSGNRVISDGLADGIIQNFDCRTLVIAGSDVIVPGDRLTLTMERQ